MAPNLAQTGSPSIKTLTEHEELNKWCSEVLYKIHLDLHTPDWDPEILSRIDPKQIIGTVARAGSPMIYFFAKDCYGNAYYDTKAGIKHPCIGQRDLLREILEEAKRQNVKVVAYYSVIWDNRMAHMHEDWRMRYADGRPASDTVTTDGASRWQYLCHNSGYIDYVCSMLEEIVTEYPVVGFHLDMLNMDFGTSSCYCDNCRTLFRKQTGLELPLPDKWDETWRKFLDFRYDSVERFALRMREAVHKHRPGLPIIMNYHGAPNFDWRTGQLPVRHSLYSDMGTGETYTPMLGDFYPGIESRFVRAIKPRRPFEVVSWRMNRITDYSTKPRHQMRWELFTSLAHGGSIMIIDQPFHDGWLDEAPYEELGRIFNEIESKRPYFTGEPIKHVGIYYSARSRDHYARTNQALFALPVQGAYKAAIENHFNIGFLFDETAELEDLLEYPVIFLPNVGALNAVELERFRNYVREGGTLISSFSTSLHDEFGEVLPNFQLADVFGVDYVDTVDHETYFLRAIPEELGEGVDPKSYLLGMGPVHKVKPTTARELGDLHLSLHKREIPTRYFSHNVHPPHIRMQGAVYVNQFGQGTSIYYPYGMDSNYANLSELPEQRVLIGNAIRKAGYQAPIEIVSAPLNVEFTINSTEDGFIVHALAFNPTRQAATLPNLNTPIRPSIRMDEPMIYRATLRFNVACKNVRVINGDGRFKVEGNTISFTSEDVHEIILFTR